MYSVWLIQDVIAPYRVPLFREIANRADIDFSVVLTAAECKYRPYWRTKPEEMPFRVLTMKGLSILLSRDKSVLIPFGLFLSLVCRKPDIVICSGFGLSTLIVYIYTKLFGRKYIVWSESTETSERIRRRDGRLRRLLRKVLASSADAFVDAGTLARDYMKSLLPKGSRPMFFRSYNCVDSNLFSAGLDKCSDVHKLESPKKILFVGRLDRNKNVPMLLDIYNDVLENYEAVVSLVLVGEGPLRTAVEQFQKSHATARISLEGQLPYDKVSYYYQMCDVFVLLSLSDCNPLVIFEALHCGIPIVCTNRAGNAPDFIIPGENGYIVDPTDRDSVTQRVIEVLSWDSEKRHNAAYVSRQLVAAANYGTSAQAFIDACSAVVRSCVAKRK